MQWVTPTQIGALKEWIVGPAVGAAVWALINRAITSSREKLHAIMTVNANRTRDELIVHIDQKFAQHETSAFARLDEQDRRLTELEKIVKEVSATLLKGR